jgi:hypothetical protein
MAFENTRTGALGPILLAVLLVAGVLLSLYFPTVPDTVLGWVALFVIGLPTWFFLEWLGTVVLGAKVIARLSSPARIAIGVPLVIALAIVGVFLIRFGQWVIAGA